MVSRLGIILYDIQEKCPIFALPFPFFCLSKWVRIGPDPPPLPPPPPGRRNLGYQPPNTPIPFGILAKNWNAKKKNKMLSKV